MRKPITLMIMLGLIGAVCTVYGQDKEPGIKGMNAPQWHVEKWIDGEGNPMEIDRTQYNGRVVYILCFQYGNPKCHEKSFPAMKEVYAAYKDNPNVKFLAIQTVLDRHEFNSMDKLVKTQNKHDLHIPFGHDIGGKHTKGKPFTMLDYKFNEVPWVIIISKDENVLFNGRYISGEDGKLVIKKELRGW